jgi:tetratricopeptide (TPR) repeat protein
MVCPYCGFKNAPTALVCNECGILLNLGRTSRLIPQGGGGGGMAFMRGLLPGTRLRGQLAALQTRLEEQTTAIRERAEEDLKVPQRASAARLMLGALYLVGGEIEKSVHWFQQTRHTGGGDVEFYNNAGVALARRGTLPQAADMFGKAARMDSAQAAPPANLAHLFAEAAADPDPEGAAVAIAQIRGALKLEPKNPTLYSRLALILCRERRYDEAAAQATQALSLASDEPAQADARNSLGLALSLAGDMPAAETAFAEALRRDASHARAQVNLALTQMRDVSALGASVERLGRAARLDPADGGVRADHGYGLCQVGAVNDGILELKEAIAINSRLTEALYNLGKAYADGDALELAERYLARALQFSPHSAPVQTALGVIKTRQRIIAPAVQLFGEVIKVWPQDALARTNLGIAQGLAGAYAEATLHLKKAGKLTPDDPHIPAQLGWLALIQDNLTMGMEELGIAIKMGAHLPEVENNYGICYVALGKPELAPPHFKRALDLNPDFHTVHYQWGCALAAMKQQDSALREWDLAARFEPGNADCHVNRGVVFYQKGQTEEAIAAFRHVVALRQTRMEDFSNLGLSYAKAGKTLHDAARNSKRPQDPRPRQALDRHNQAIDMFDRALALAPLNVMLHSNRGLACFFAGRAEDAMHEWGRVSQLDPAYANRRGKRIQSEYDDTQVAMVPFSVPARAAHISPRTGPYQPLFLAGYDVEAWDLILGDPALARLAEMRRDARHLEREVAALGGK